MTVTYIGFLDDKVETIDLNNNVFSDYDVVFEYQVNPLIIRVLGGSCTDHTVITKHINTLLEFQVNKTVVIYHANCADGLTGAAIAKKALGDNVVFVPGSYGKVIKTFIDCTIYFIDFSYKRKDMEDILICNDVILIDHHKSAIEDLMEIKQDFHTFYVSVDNSLSGAGLAWKYFYGSSNPPRLVQYVQDRDLWTWEFESSAPFLKYLDTTVPKTVEAYFEELRKSTLDPIEYFDPAIRDGAIMLSVEEAIEDNLVKRNTVMRTILNYPNVPCVNATGEFASKVGNKLLLKHLDAPFSVVWYLDEDGIKISLRSTNERKDVSLIASEISPNGGGHSNAAGVRIGSTEIPIHIVAKQLLGLL